MRRMISPVRRRVVCTLMGGGAVARTSLPVPDGLQPVATTNSMAQANAWVKPDRIFMILAEMNSWRRRCGVNFGQVVRVERRGTAVCARLNHGEYRRQHEQRRCGCKQQSADHRATERRGLATAFANAKRHRRHAR